MQILIREIGLFYLGKKHSLLELAKRECMGLMAMTIVYGLFMTMEPKVIYSCDLCKGQKGGAACVRACIRSPSVRAD